jgi:hypothetical protein
MKGIGTILTVVLFSVPALAQSHPMLAELPSAPVAAGVNLSAQNLQAGGAPAATTKDQLTRAQAEQMALKNNPRISVS